MLELVPDQPKKLSADFLEKAGIRCFETNEFKDWYEAIHAILGESGVELSVDVIRELFCGLPDSADDEIFALTLISYLVDNNLLTKAQVEDEGWDAIFPSKEEMERVHKETSGTLAEGQHLRAELERTIDQMAS